MPRFCDASLRVSSRTSLDLRSFHRLHRYSFRTLLLTPFFGTAALSSIAKLTKLFHAYAARFQVDIRSLRFISQHGIQLPKHDPTATVRGAGLEDEDEVDVMLEQFGGA